MSYILTSDEDFYEIPIWSVGKRGSKNQQNGNKKCLLFMNFRFRREQKKNDCLSCFYLGKRIQRSRSHNIYYNSSHCLSRNLPCKPDGPPPEAKAITYIYGQPWGKWFIDFLSCPYLLY